MKIKWSVLKAAEAVGAFRRRLYEADFSWTDDRSVDLHRLCTLYLSCELVLVEGLSDRAAVRYLENRYGVDTSRMTPDDTPLAGGLYLGRRGLPRWIFIERRDALERQRFTIAHEIGHLILQAEAEISRRAEAPGELFTTLASEPITRFSRCAHGVVDRREDEVNPERSRSYRANVASPQGQPNWTQADLSEFDANHFAAELLMPLVGIRRVIAQETGATGVKNEQHLERLVSLLATTYEVSHAAARKRLIKDLGIVPRSQDPNVDLFL